MPRLVVQYHNETARPNVGVWRISIMVPASRPVLNPRLLAESLCTFYNYNSTWE